MNQVLAHVAWWSQSPAPGPDSEPVPAGAPAYVPPQHKLTTLGWLKHVQDPAAPYFEWQYLKCIHKFLTERWWILQGGRDEEALDEWLLVMKVLELDQKAHRDLFLLAQSGLVGRTHANKILWHLLTGPAVDTSCVDLSNLVTHEVYKARRNFDRAPREHRDLGWWWWTYYESTCAKDKRWSPAEVPTPRTLRTGEGGGPLQPPECWGTAYPR